MIGKFTPTAADNKAKRVAGFGLTTNIINGGLECGSAYPTNKLKHDDRVAYYTRYVGLFGVTVGDNPSCQDQNSY